jgi:dihydrofolate synthase/folylpolyglutamate synthase
VIPVVENAMRERHAAGGPITIDRADTGGATGGYRFENFALAVAAARSVVDQLDGDAVERVYSGLVIPGRAEAYTGDPPTVYDAAHNADGARALARVLPELAGGRDVVCCLAILEGKDATGIVHELAPAVSHFISTEIPPERIEGSGRPGGRSKPALEVAELCRRAGVEAEAIPDPLDAWRRAKDLARERDGVALAAGSHYLLSSIWTERPAQSF